MATLLLVEDNEMNRDMLSRRLSRRGYRVCTAESGRAGLELVRSIRPDLIIMDLSLPDVDGWEATRMLKSDSQTLHIPIIVLTAHAMEEDRRRAFEAGCDDFDTKPVEFGRLLGMIERLLLKSGTESAHG